jgi:lipopolysaccharide cholinephosphotransferase
MYLLLMIISYKKLFNKIVGTVILIFGIYQAYVYFYNPPWRYITPIDKQVVYYSTPPKNVLNLYQIMKDTHEILTKHNITYWIDSGTLLGAIRHKGIIPFDDDLDIGIMHSEEPKFQEILNDFRDLGYTISHNKIYSICNEIGCVDVFVTHQIGDKFTYTNLSVGERFPNNHFYINELFPLKKYQFGNLELYGPNEPKPNLDRQYPEWDKYAVIQQPHKYHIILSRIEKRTKFILTPKLLEAAQPFSPLKDRVFPND